MASGLTPLDDAFAALRLEGFKINGKLWDKLRQAGLVKPAQRLPRSKTYGISTVEYARLRHILDVKQRMRGRWLMSRLGLALALDGDPQVPAELIRAELRRRFYQNVGRVTRAFARYARIPVRIKSIKRDDLAFAARRLAKRWTKSRRDDFRYPIYRDALEKFTFTVLKMVFLGASALEGKRAIRSAIYDFMIYDTPKTGRLGFSDEEARTLAKQLAEWLDETRSWLVVEPSRNKLLGELDAIPADELVAIAAQGPRMVETLRQAMTKVGSVLPPGGKRFIDDFLKEPLVPEFLEAFSVAAMISERHTDRGKEVLTTLRAGALPLPPFTPRMLISISQLIEIERIRHERVASDYPSIKAARRVNRGRRLRRADRR